MNVQKKFQLKIQTLSKMIGAPSGVQTKFEKNSLAANSGMFIGTKNVIAFLGDFFNSFWPAQAKCEENNLDWTSTRSAICRPSRAD